ncbi:MAG: phenylalanine--tRNA ligase subunit beta [Clostridia bacterium]|nr:phenylalanine--tRNA ligase subunit beta [Clostridia bacterium]
MLVPIKWLKDYTDVNVDADEFVRRMVLSGSNLETVEHFGEGIEGVVIGRISKIEKHPNADKLLVCMIDVGKAEPVQIVTGAHNIFEGALVPVCLDGSHIPGPLHGQPKVEGGVTIHAGQLRGVDSFGMLCSCSELGFDDKVVPVASREGIWILPDEFKPGQDIVEAMGLKETVVDFEITPNRPDCLSMLGMAREASATFGTPLRYPDTECKKVAPEKSEDYIKISIERPDLCKRYCGRVIKDIKVEQSPWWLQRCLIFSGQRPINNIVDITNFVMLEYGQPLHAFDIRTVRGSHIIVDTAADGEKFTTLDGNERTLTSSMLMIKDEGGPTAVAGVMGGLASEIEEGTSMVLVESANFLGDSVRRTSKALGLRTEASGRFEKGIDPNLAKDACDRFCYLVEQLGAGTVLTGDVDVYPNVEEPVTIDIRASRMNKLMGVEISAEQMCAYLNALEIKTSVNGDIITVTAPTVRQDLLIEEDYVEEISRLYGYDKLPVALPKHTAEVKLTPKQELRNLAKNVLTGLGLDEIQTYSFVSPKASDKVRIPEGDARRQFVKLINPLGEDTSVMRTMILPNALDVLATNYSRSIPEARVFELGNTFFNNGNGPDGLPEEKDALCIAAYGPAENFYVLKGRVEELLRILGVKGTEFVTESADPSFHPGRCARILKDGVSVGVLGQVYPEVSEAYGISCEVYAAELDFAKIAELSDREKKYVPLPKYPAMVRDFALVVAEEVKAGDLEKLIASEAGGLLEGVKLFDVYRGVPVPPLHKSLAFSLTYRAKDRTLTDAEVNAINEKVLAALKSGFNAVLREI